MLPSGPGTTKGTMKLTDVNAQADGEDSSGIMIYHNGTVELNRVNASNNAYVGAYIENFATGAIKITNSTFENNLLECYMMEIFGTSIVLIGMTIGNCTDSDPIWYRARSRIYARPGKPVRGFRIEQCR